MSEILHIKKVVHSNTQHLATDIKNPAQREIRDLAIDRCIERFFPCVGMSGRMRGNLYEKAVGIEVKEISK